MPWRDDSGIVRPARMLNSRSAWMSGTAVARGERHLLVTPKRTRQPRELQEWRDC